jgi:hypothetical protein
MAAALALPTASQAATARAGNYLPTSVIRSGAQKILNNILVNSDATGGHIIACERVSQSTGKCSFTDTFLYPDGSTMTCTGRIVVKMLTGIHYSMRSYGTSCR